MTKASRSASQLPFNYPQLQNLIKRDPESYREEFLQQYSHFKSSLAILKVQPDAVEEHFEALVMFLAHVVGCYELASKEFPGILMELLENEGVTLPSGVRRCLVQCLMLVRKKKLIELEPVLTLFFRLFRVPDKQLRELLYESIVGEIKRANTPHKNNGLNKRLQNLLFALLQQQQKGQVKRARNDSPEGVASHKALQVMIELYRRGVWRDERTVNVVAEACTSQISYKTTVTALNFFLGRCRKKSALSLADGDESGDESEEEDDDEPKEKLPSMKQVMYKMQVAGSKSSKSGKTKMRKFKAMLRKQELEKDSSKATDQFAAIHLLNDPYGFVERLFSMLKSSTDSFAFKLLTLNVISRVIGAHQLIFLDLYSFLLRYIQPHQRNVTQVLAYTAQASHELVPPDVLAPLLRAIANNFVSDHCRSEVISAGLNGLAQVCTRCPLAMDSTLLQDLAQYKGYQDKAVSQAARGLISLYREHNPELLHRKDRGKDASMAVQRGVFSGPKAYGHVDVKTVPAGLELIVKSDAEDEDEGDSISDVNLVSEAEWNEDEFEEASDIEFDSDSDCVESEADQEEEEAVPKAEDKMEKMLAMATQKIFSPADFAMLKRKRIEATLEAASSGPIKHHPKNKKARKDADELEVEDDDQEDEAGPSEIVKPSSIQSLGKKPKADYAARMESIKAGREGRLDFGSKKGKADRGSSTNADKSKRKNQQMMAHKFSVRQKKQRSLREKQKVIKAHAKRQKLKRK